MRRTRQPREAIAAPPIFAFLILILALAVMLLAGCDLPFLSARSSPTPAHPTPTAVPTLAANKGGATITLAGPAASAAHCMQVPGFESAPAASGGAAFADVPFPAQSVGAIAPAAGSLYAFQLMTVCTPEASANVLTFYAKQMLASGWVASPTYPYGGDPAHACGDPYCWRKATTKATTTTVRYVSLERMSSSSALTLYTLRLATAPVPQASPPVVRSASGAGRGGGSLTVSASCQAGEQMVGGGYSISSGDHTYAARSSYPSATATWTVSVTSSGSTPFELQTYVGCVQANYSLGIQIVTALFPASDDAVATCPSGAVTGGGAKIDGTGAILAGSAPTDDGKSWHAVAFNGPTVVPGTVYAVCATRSLDIVPSTKRSFTIESGNDAQANLACSADQWLTSGGFSNMDPSADGKNVFALDAPTADYSRWFLQGHNVDAASGHSATIWATCVHPDPWF